MALKLVFGGGTLHCQIELSPQSRMEWSALSPILWLYPAAIIVKDEFDPAGPLACPLSLFPQATTEPSAFKPIVCDPPPKIDTKSAFGVGTSHWPWGFHPQQTDRKSTRLNSSHIPLSRMP